MNCISNFVFDGWISLSNDSVFRCQAMWAVVAISIAGITGFIARRYKTRPWHAWLIGCAVVPLFVLVDEFVLTTAETGASLWPAALLFGTFYGAVSSALGVFIAGRFGSHKTESDRH
ncbi:MAG: hypothetical protein ABW076_04705 [Candidatus Thiodiazotropha sp.]